MKKFVIILVVIGIIGFIFKDEITDRFKKVKETIIPEKIAELKTEPELVNINKYYIYGTHLNIIGSINLADTTNISTVVLNLYNGTDRDIPLIYENENNVISFMLAKEINNGLYLDDLALSDYYFYLKITMMDNSIKYYKLSNQTKYNNIDYYPVMHNKKAIKQQYVFDTKFNTLKLTVQNNNQSDKIYDIVIDPGHGGMDGGASYNGAKESDYTITFSLMLKDELEKLGLKVKLTRDSMLLSSNEMLEKYGPGGRASIPNEVKAKYLFSIHLNSAPGNVRSGGVEIYTPSNINYTFAKDLAVNIVSSAGTSYSGNDYCQVSEGIYTRNFTKADINESAKENKENGYDAYNITTSTPYYYMIREPGGMITGAYVDGRNPDELKNLYYDSNVSVESYILELGYIINKTDYNNLINNKIGYINGIVSAIKKNLNIN